MKGKKYSNQSTGLVATTSYKYNGQYITAMKITDLHKLVIELVGRQPMRTHCLTSIDRLYGSEALARDRRNDELIEHLRSRN